MDRVLFLDDSELYIPVFSDVCSHCAHWFIETGRKCEAFPDGIPMEIWMGKNKHISPVKGDHGVQFEKRILKNDTDR